MLLSLGLGFEVLRILNIFFFSDYAGGEPLVVLVALQVKKVFSSSMIELSNISC